MEAPLHLEVISSHTESVLLELKERREDTLKIDMGPIQYGTQMVLYPIVPKKVSTLWDFRRTKRIVATISFAKEGGELPSPLKAIRIQGDPYPLPEPTPEQQPKCKVVGTTDEFRGEQKHKGTKPMFEIKHSLMESQPKGVIPQSQSRYSLPEHQHGGTVSLVDIRYIPPEQRQEGTVLQLENEHSPTEHQDKGTMPKIESRHYPPAQNKMDEPPKNKLGQLTVGHHEIKVSSKGVRVDSEQVRATTPWLLPKDPNRLKKILGSSANNNRFRPGQGTKRTSFAQSDEEVVYSWTDGTRRLDRILLAGKAAYRIGLPLASVSHPLSRVAMQ
jgi:hypothetical protein